MQHIADWTQSSSHDETKRFLTELAQVHCRKGGKQGLIISGFLASNDYAAVCNYSLVYDDISAHEAYHCRQALAFFGKLGTLDLGLDKRAEAIRQLEKAEADCRFTNECFRARAAGIFFMDPWVESVLYRAQSKIARVLGNVPSFSELSYRHGPGATTLTKKSQASVVEKLQAGISCSEDLLPYAARLLEEMPHWAELHETTSWCDVTTQEEIGSTTVLIQNDIVDFVPKNAKTLRSITKGGSLNMMCQLALGDYMTKRLRAFGVDLTDRTRNQKLALEGSLCGSYATLDLSSASDTISTEIVLNLLPIEWVIALDSCRSSSAVLDGTPFRLEKFSSMGNGYTFPLESLIFWALSSCAAEDGFASVYGDDIIVTTDNVPAVRRILEVCGFTLNMKKSYWTGPFRESCGADYIRGIDIRPYYQKTDISPMELFKLHNFYVRSCQYDMADLVRDQIHPILRIYGPDNFGDGHLLGDWVPKRKKRFSAHGYGGVIFDTFKLAGVRDKRALRPGDRVLPLYTVYRREAGECVIPEQPDHPVKGLANYLGRLRKFQNRIASEPLPERVSQVDGTFIKCPSLPGTDGYKRVSIYTLSTN